MRCGLISVSEQASPLRLAAPLSVSAVEDDVGALESGKPSNRHLQRLSVFSSDHKIPLREASDKDDGSVAEVTLMWNEGRLFDRIFGGVLAVLEPTRVGH
jgi:hypothetical protein